MQAFNLALAALAAATLTAACPSANAQARFDFDRTPGRLSKSVVPSHYLLSFDLDPALPRFNAEARISLRLRIAQDSLQVHAHELQASSAVLIDTAGRELPLQVRPELRSQTWRLRPTSRLPAGDYTLAIRYSGIVHYSGEGLYKTAETDTPMLATQLEAVQARTLFPGFDEPAFRATFEIEVKAPKGLEVLSNMPAASVTDDGLVSRHHFASTPAMPSYLVTLAVGRFDILEGEAGGVPLRIITAPGKRELGRYALQATQQVLPYYENYFGVRYALPKLDQLAVPSVRTGAMEDWGLISYAEPALLFDPARTGQSAQRSLYNTIAHEVAHQWFGNLVTASSWDEIWLNEAFATWLAAKTTDHFNPGWQIPLSERAHLEETLARDAGTATRAIRGGRVDETNVFDVFDSITYAKGGAVLGMIEQWLGDDVFRRGLAAYVAERRFSNATAGDLWHHLSAASGRDVSRVTRSWTDQIGHPLVQVRSVCVDGQTRVSLRQRRFLSVSATDPRAQAAAVWQVPVRLQRGAEQQTVLLDRPQRDFLLQGCRPDPLVVNAGGAGFYRVRYEPQALEQLTRSFAGLPAADKVALFSDAFALAQAGQQPLSRWFELLAQLPAVGDASRATLFGQAAGGLDWLDAAMGGGPAQGAVRRAGRALFNPELERLGWQPAASEDDETQRLRAVLIRQLARFDDTAVLARAGALYTAASDGSAAVAASIREAVTVAAGRGADRPRFDQMRDRLMSSPSAEERKTLARALAAGADRARLAEFLALSTSRALPADIAADLPGMVAAESAFGTEAYGFALTHWSQLAALSGSSAMGERQWLLPGTTFRANQRSDATRLRVDQRRLAGPSGAMQAGEQAGAIELRATVREREAKGLPALLAGWQPAR